MRLLALVLGAVLLAGCGTEFVSDPPREPRPTFAPDPEIDGPVVVDPTAVGIAKIGAWSTLVPLGLTDQDCPDVAPCLDTPPIEAPMQAGWYAGADPAVSGDEYQPGEPGPAVIAGHVDGNGKPGIFQKLPQLAPGDKITVERNDPDRPQPPLVFVVTEVGTYGKNAFPTERVYGATERPELRLITCGGSFDAASGHYRDNVVVWAELE